MNYNAAHDFKGIISAISGINSLLRTEINPTKNDSKINSLLNMMDDICKEGSEISSELLFSGELETLVNKEYEMHDYSLNALVKEVAQKFWPQIHRKNILFVVNTPDYDITCKVNYNHIKRALTNLVDNAFKFTNIDGKIILKLSFKDEVATISVSDNGIGIPEKLQPIIFNRFSDARRRGILDEATSGLGLSIVKQIIEIHKGQINFQSTVTAGTTFNILLKCPIHKIQNIPIQLYQFNN